MLLQQQFVAAASWVGPTMAVSLAVMALATIIFAGVVAYVALKIVNEVQERKMLLTGVREDVQETLSTIREVAGQAQEVMNVVRLEAGAFVQTGRRIRRKVNRGVDRIERRMQDLEALYDVVHEEVEDTALDLAASLRRVRSGRSMIGKVRRFLVPGR
jgi:methyl-accepting chemotaxis protein